MIEATINSKPIHVEEGTTILEAARKALVHIPTLCKHPDLDGSGACGICVVKIGGSGQMVRACSTVVAPAMKIVTHDPEIIETRRTTLELILSTHPNECLTCGRNRTCELQQLAEEFSIRNRSFKSQVRDLPTDSSTGAIVLEPRKCIKCRRCITVCQEKQNVWALSLLERGINTRIAPAGASSLEDSPCVRCGQCSAHCPVGAIIENDDTAAVWQALADPEIYCVAQVAPAVRVSLGEVFGYPSGTNLTGQLYDSLRLLGFDAVFDTNFGADVTVMEEANELARRLTDHKEDLPLITTCCPSWVAYMEEFHPALTHHFSSCKSPHAIVGTLAKTYYAKQAGIQAEKMRVVSIMPCTSKKYEISRSSHMYASGFQDVDISITSRELVRMVQQHGIAFAELNCLVEPDSPLGDHSGAGLIFGTSGGVMEAVLRSASNFMGGGSEEQLSYENVRGSDGLREMTARVGGRELRLAVAHGLSNVEALVQKIEGARETGEDPPFHFVEVMACPEGCVGGGGQAWNVSNDKRRTRCASLFKEDGFKTVKCSHENPSIEKLYSEFIGEPLGETARKLLHTKNGRGS